MKAQWMVVVMVCVLGCGNSADKEQSDACKRAMDSAHRTWGVYIKAIDNEQPKIAKKATKFAPEGYADLAAASKEAIEAWQQATLEAKELATKARFGKPGSDRLEPGRAALASAEFARERALIAIDRAFAARLRKGLDAIKRDTAALTPEKGKRLSAKARKELEAKLEATKARVSKNNGKIEGVKNRLIRKADALLDFAKKTVEGDAAAVAECAQ